MRSALLFIFSLGALLLFAKAAEDRVCVRNPLEFPCRSKGGCGSFTPFKYDGACPFDSKELNRISRPADQEERQCRKVVNCRDRRVSCVPKIRTAKGFDWKGPCPKRYQEDTRRVRVCKRLRCKGGAKKCTLARKSLCDDTERELSPEKNRRKTLRSCWMKNCRRRCQVKVRGFCPPNTDTLRRSGGDRRKSAGRSGGNDYGAEDYEVDDYGADDFKADDFKTDDYEADEYEAEDYDAYEYESDDYEADDYEADDYNRK